MPRAATTSDSFNAVAEPRRRDILDFLAPAERPVGDIVAALGLAAAVGLQAPAGAAGRRAGRGAAGRPSGVLSYERRGNQAGARMDRPIRALLAPPARRESKNAPSAIEAQRREPHTEETTMTAIAPAIDNLSLNITRGNPRSRAPRRDLRGAARGDGPGNEGHNGTPDADDARGLARRPLVPRSRRRQRPLVGHVQAIKRPTLLEITGPLLMSFAGRLESCSTGSRRPTAAPRSRCVTRRSACSRTAIARRCRRAGRCLSTASGAGWRSA